MTGPVAENKGFATSLFPHWQAFLHTALHQVEQARHVCMVIRIDESQGRRWHIRDKDLDVRIGLKLFTVTVLPCGNILGVGAIRNSCAADPSIRRCGVKSKYPMTGP